MSGQGDGGFLEPGTPDRITFGVIGPVGERVFYLQSRTGGAVLTLKLEKQQVGALSERLGALLHDLERPGELPEEDMLELDDFVEAQWAVGVLGLAYDPSIDRVVLLADELVAEGEVGRQAQFVLTREQAGALAIRGTRLVQAGRPPCPLCGFPLDPRGHACPRTNGHRPPQT